MDHVRDSEDDEVTAVRKPKSRASRDSRQIDDAAIGDEMVNFTDDEEAGYDDVDDAPKREPKSRSSRESRQMDDYEIVNDVNLPTPEPPDRRTRGARDSMQMDDLDIPSDRRMSFTDHENLPTPNTSDGDNSPDPPITTPPTDSAPTKRVVKTRASRESRQIDDGHDMEMVEDEEPLDQNRRRRAARDSMQIDDMELETEDIADDGPLDGIREEAPRDAVREKEIVTVRDDNFGYNMQIDSMTNKTVKRAKARGSMQLDQPALTATALETFAEHQMEAEAAAINGPADDKVHQRSDTMNSNSSAYKAFMTVD